MQNSSLEVIAMHAVVLGQSCCGTGTVGQTAQSFDTVALVILQQVQFVNARMAKMTMHACHFFMLRTMDLMGDNISLWQLTNVTILITTKNRQKKLEKF